MSGFNVISILCAILCLQLISRTTGDASTERRLHDDLLMTMDNTIAPSRMSQKVLVNLSVSIIRVDSLSWKEPMLQWSVPKYGNISHTLLPVSYIWTPDLSVFTAIKASDVFPEIPKAVKVVVRHDGMMTFVIPQSVTVPANCKSESLLRVEMSQKSTQKH